jgi:hypothetical protein
VYQTSPDLIFRITNPFSQSRPELWAITVSSVTSATFTLKINGLKNPDSVKQAGDWTVTTYNEVGGSYYVVDTGTSTTGTYTPVNGILTASGTGGLVISDRSTYIDTASYRFLINLQHTLPQRGKIKFVIPSDFTLQSSVICYHQKPTVTAVKYT